MAKSKRKIGGEGNGARANGAPVPAATVVVDRKPRCLAIANAGVTTGHQFARLMSALMSDVIEGNVTPAVCSAAVNAGGKLLKVVEMTSRLGTKQGGSTKKLVLTDES